MGARRNTNGEEDEGSLDGEITAVGLDGAAPADYDGDGKTDIAVYRNGLWIMLQSNDGGVTATQFGVGTDVPLN